MNDLVANAEAEIAATVARWDKSGTGSFWACHTPRTTVYSAFRDGWGLQGRCDWLHPSMVPDRGFNRSSIGDLVEVLAGLLGELRGANEPGVAARALVGLDRITKHIAARRRRQNARMRRARQMSKSERACPCCGKPIPASAHGRQRFCSARCRVAGHRAGL